MIVFSFKKQALGLNSLRLFGFVEILEAWLAWTEFFGGRIVFSICSEFLIVLFLEFLLTPKVIILREDSTREGIGLFADARDE